jgi:hypothetical protein
MQRHLHIPKSMLLDDHLKRLAIRHVVYGFGVRYGSCFVVDESEYQVMGWVGYIVAEYNYMGMVYEMVAGGMGYMVVNMG